MIRYKAVNDAIDFIMQHINEDLSVDDIAAHCHFPNIISADYFAARQERAFILL